MKLLIRFFFISLVCLLPAGVYAHVTQTDGPVSVLLHTDPDDDPIVSQPATIHFLVTDTSKKFAAANCNCSVDVSLDGKDLLAQKLTADAVKSIYQYSVPFSFSSKGVYTINFSGSSKTANGFNKFSFSYILRVDRTGGNAKQQNTAQIITAVGIGVLGLWGAWRLYKKNNLS